MLITRKARPVVLGQLDCAEDLRVLPSPDRVRRTLSLLVPAECLRTPSASWILAGGIAALKKSESRVEETPVQEMTQRDSAAGQHAEDARVLSPTQLRKKYELTYSSWTNMKSRCKSNEVPVHPRFMRFADFLVEVGPRLSREFTLDRIDPSSPRYEPGGVRWLDKTGQANNRECTIVLEHEGVKKPISLWAHETCQSADTLRARRRKGWSDSEVITGVRSSPQSPRPSHLVRPWDLCDPEDRARAEEFFQKNKLKGELPFPFCIRYFGAGLDPWETYIHDLDPDLEFEILTPECQSVLREALTMIAEFAPRRIWLERKWQEISPRLGSVSIAEDEPW